VASASSRWVWGRHRQDADATVLPDGPAELGGGGAGVGVALGGGGADHAAGDFLVEAFAVRGLEGLFHAAVFAGVEGEDGEASAWIEAVREDAQEGVEGGEFFVHFDADGLEDAADGEFALFTRDQGERGLNRGGEICGGGEIVAGEDGGELRGVGFVGVIGEDRGEFCG